MTQDTIKRPDLRTSLSLMTGVLLILIPTYSYVISAISYLMGLQPLSYAFPAASVVGILTGTVFFERKRYALSVVYALLIAAVSIALGILVYDCSFDGNYYHQEIITALCSGWNPYRHTMDFPGLMMWDYHYAKALEIIAADIVALTGRLESGKAVNLMLASGTLLLSYHFIRETLKVAKKKAAMVLSALVVLNPVVICQIFTYYIDFSLYLYWVITLIASVSIAKKGDTLLHYIILDCTVILAIGTKFNAFFIEGVMIGIAILGYCLYGHKETVKTYLLNILAIGIFGAFIIGYHPYVTNTLLQGNPLYPLIGNPDVDIMTPTTPPEFLESNRFINFFRSIFSLMPPSFDSRKGGFGPIFGLIFLISVATLLVKIYKEKRISVFSYIMLCILASCFIFEQSWWARYNPQLWLLVPGCYLEFVKSEFRHRKAVIDIFVLMVGLNLLVCAANTMRLSTMTRVERTVLFKTLRSDSVYLHNSKIHWVRQLEENGIHVLPKERQDIELTDTAYLYGFKSDLFHFPYVRVDRNKYESIDSVMKKSIFHRISKSVKPD